MTSIKLMLTGAQAWAVATGPLTSGMVGIPITIECDESWNGLTKNLMCRCSPWGSTDGEYRAILNVGETATVSHEVMLPDMYLYLGVEGYSDDGKLVMPTIWARCGKIEYGANTCDDPSTDPELPVWNQLQIEMEKTKEYVLTPEQAVNIQTYAQTATQAAEEAQQAAEEARQAVESGLYYIPVVSQPTETALKFEFKPSLTGAPVPKPVTVVLPVGSGTGGGLTTVQINALHEMFKVCVFDDSQDADGAIAVFEEAFGLASGDDSNGEDTPEVTTYTIAYELVNITSNSSVFSVNEGASCSATLTAADGYTMEGAAVTVTMGGVDVTAYVYANGVISIPAVTGNVEIVASAVHAEKESAPKLNTDGLLGFFDFRNRAKSSGDSSAGYYEAATVGNGRLYAWAQKTAANEYGKDIAAMQFCAGAGYTVHDFGSEFTWILKAYCDGGCTLTGASAYMTPSNQGTVLAPKYNTSASTGNVASTTVGKDWSRAYHTVAIRASGSKLHIFKNAEQIAEYDGADIDDFVSWYGKCTVNSMWASENTILVSTAMAFYDRALTDVEIVEMDEYLKTLEVSA